MHETPSPAPTLWDLNEAKKLYRLDGWGDDHFSINDEGEVTVRLASEPGEQPSRISIPSIIEHLKNERGIGLPVLLRFPYLLQTRIALLHDSFRGAIADLGYQNGYQGAYPIKVNQRAEVVEEITRFGKNYHYGLEVGTKTELVAALGNLNDPQALIICNGYKDHSYIRLALLALKMGLNVILVIERPRELDTILECANEVKIEPQIGLRYKLSSEGVGRWSGTSGEKGLFGVNISQIVEILDRLRETDKLNCLKMLHYHQGSQLCNLPAIEAAAYEAACIYSELVSEGAAMGYLNIGGGLAVDYDGTASNSANSKNYTVAEYANAVISNIKDAFDERNVEHPIVVSESGRGVAAYYSVLIFDVLGVNRFEGDTHVEPTEDDLPTLTAMLEIASNLGSSEDPEDDETHINTLEALYNDTVTGLYSDKSSLRDCARAERVFREAVVRIDSNVRAPRDFYYGNFSVFQSLPDHWALGQFFPVMPLHRLGEEPTRKAILADLTCDSDGKIKTYIHERDESPDYIPVHPLEKGESYLIGAFLVGAYQETLGDMHNLFGTTHVVSVESDEDGEINITRVVDGDSAEEVLGYLEYNVSSLVNRLEKWTSQAVKAKRITSPEKELLMKDYKNSLKSYTYLTNS
jgi:arginine decarboxylase